jgi:hypothetical protein
LAINSGLALLKVLRSLDSTEELCAKASAGEGVYCRGHRNSKTEKLTRDTPAPVIISNSATPEVVEMPEPS